MEEEKISNSSVSKWRTEHWDVILPRPVVHGLRVVYLFAKSVDEPQHKLHNTLSKIFIQFMGKAYTLSTSIKIFQFQNIEVSYDQRVVFQEFNHLLSSDEVWRTINRKFFTYLIAIQLITAHFLPCKKNVD